MNKSLFESITLSIILLIIWYITKFFDPVFTIPFWLSLLVVTKLNSYKLASILIVSEIFIGIDTFLIGPFSIIQIFGLIIIARKINQLNKIKRYFKLFSYLIIVTIYFTLSYYSYFETITLAPINWLFIFFITTITFSINKNEILFYITLQMISISIVVLINFTIHVMFGLEFVKKISFGNPNQIGFFSLINLIYIIVYKIYCSPDRNKLLIQLLFYLNLMYIIYTSSRLNTFILIVFFIILFIFPIREFWINRTKMLIISIGLIFLVISSNLFSNFIFRNQENKSLNNFKFQQIEDLNDSNLGSFTSARSVIYFDAINLINEKPIFGNGFLSWNDKKNKYNSLITGKEGSRISMHSTILQYWAETGIIGLSLYIFYLSIIIVNGKKIMKNSSNIEIKIIGKMIILIVIFMIIGGTLDNHSLSYSFIHFIGGLSLIYLTKKKENENSILH